jgi:hypothetical protein
MPTIERTCRYRECQRPARKGWTNCAKHYSAGRAYTKADEIKDLRSNADRTEPAEREAER